MSRLDLKAGDIIRHLKRGSVYEVVGHSVWHAYDLRDNKDITRYLARDQGLAMQVRMQESGRLPNAPVGVIYYRALVSKPGEPWLFMRPLVEFTTDRFEKVTP